MMGTEKTLVNVNKGQDAYSVIGNYILNHATAIEDMIAVIQINGVIIKELYMVNVDAAGYFYWKSDWWEGEEYVALLDFFPVSDAERIKWIPCGEKLPENDERALATTAWGDVTIAERIYPPINDTCWFIHDGNTNATIDDVVAWMPLPEPYHAERREDA